MEEVLIAEEAPRLVPAVAVYLAYPKHAQTLLQLLNSLYPVRDSNAAEHLKRIRRCPPTADSPGSATMELLVELVSGDGACATVTASGSPPEQGYEALRTAVAARCGAEVASGLAPHTVHVPDRAPRQSPEVWRTWSSVWPLATPKPQPPAPPSPALVRGATAFMRDGVLPLAERIVRDRPHLLGIAAVIVAGAGEERADGASAPVSLADQCVLATSEGCEAMRRDNPLACGAYVAASASGASMDAQGRRPALVLEHPVMHALAALAARQRAAAGDGSASDATHPASDDGGDEAARQQRIAAGRPYLANNLDLYVSHEPCVMCAMALVHSRIARVFFAFPNDTHGGLGSVYAVHAVPSLNHHYRVYHCREAAEGYRGAPLL